MFFGMVFPLDEHRMYQAVDLDMTQTPHTQHETPYVITRDVCLAQPEGPVSGDGLVVDDEREAGRSGAPRPEKYLVGSDPET